MCRKLAEQKGSIIVSMLIMMLFLSSLVFGLMSLANTNLLRARSRIMVLQTMYAAESGADVAIALLNNTSENYSGSSGEVTVMSTTEYKATFSTTVTPDGNKKIIHSTGRVYIPANAQKETYSRTIEVVADRSSREGVLSMVSRNIIFIHSGVKTISGKDIHANGFIAVNKDTTDIIAESISVAGKNTSAANCSIGTSGKLVKPASFTNPEQTKTNITTAFNNCLPPYNTSNADFNVNASSTNVPTVHSTLIPASWKMDETYSSSLNGCADWTTGALPRTIPYPGNEKKTHYPSTGSGIDSNCGTNGDVHLSTGQYNITDHLHLRANLCLNNACTPTFYNPDQGEAGIKFIFVEGSVRFDSLTTAAGSGPIVFVIYGPDPAMKTDVCPYGASFYLGNTGFTSAPAAYFVSQNGICLDNAKFSSMPAIGGLTGKNIYVSTSPGSPFWLALDPNFPTNGIPLNLAWKAVRYRRL